MEGLKQNSYVRYGASGICQVLGRETRPCDRGQAEYYILQPVAEPQTTICIPVGNPALLARIQPMPDREEIGRMILSAAQDGLSWNADRNARARAFAAILREGDPRELLRLVNCIYLKKRELRQAGRRLASSDEGVLKRAERSLERDLSFVLGIREDQVGPHIRRQLGIDEADARA